MQASPLTAGHAQPASQASVGEQPLECLAERAATPRRDDKPCLPVNDEIS
jgi:hypothetical protein